VARLLLLLSKLKVLRSLQAQLLLTFALLALKTDDNFSCCLRLFVKNWLCLSSESHLLVVITALSLGKVRRFAGLVLGDFVHGVLPALLSLAVRLTFLGAIHHDEI